MTPPVDSSLQADLVAAVPHLRAFATSLCGSRERADDLVQETILKAWDKVAQRKAKENPYFARVLESQRTWAQRVVPYRRCCHPPYDLAADYYWKGVNPYKILKP
mgnify:CR=1 FL=1